MQNTNLHILLVEDEAITAQYMKTGLMKLGHIVIAVSSAEKAINQVKVQKPDLILMDIHLAGELDGFEAMKKINQIFPTPVIYITGYVDDAIKEKSHGPHSLGFLTKPINIAEIVKIINTHDLLNK